MSGPSAAPSRWPEARGDLAHQQPVAVLGEGCGVPDRIVHAEADKTAKHQVEVDTLDQLQLRANREERLQQQDAQPTLGRNGIPPRRRVKARRTPPTFGSLPRDNAANHAKRMVRADPTLQGHVAE
jgi:hypothetical protein